jgi:hypothetical protein
MFFHPRSLIRSFSITDPGSASKNLSILTQKWFLNSQKYDPGFSFQICIPDPDPGFLPIPDPGTTTLEISDLLWL